MISTQYINLNMVPSGVMPVLHCSQYDVGRPLGVVIYNGSESVDLSGYTVTIEGTRTDRTPVTAGVTTDGNIGVFTTTPTMTNENDTYRAKVVLTDNAGRVSSLAFVMCVDEKTMDENAEEIEEDASLYQQYTGTVQTIIAQIRGDLAAEITARQNAISAEASARQAADNTLQSNINAEASARATEDASLQSQINQLIAPSGSAPSAAEVENARIGSDGTVYPTLGDAIRTQNSLLKSDLGDLTYEWVDGKFVQYADGVEGSSGAYSCTDYVLCESVGISTQTEMYNDTTGICFYDIDKRFISGFNANSYNYTRFNLMIPSNAVYVRITCLDRYKSSFVLKRYDSIPAIQKSIADIKEDVSIIEQEVNTIKNIEEVSNNLLPITSKTATVFGTTANYSDGELSVSGTATNSGGRTIPVTGVVTLPVGKYTLWSTATDFAIVLQNASNNSLITEIKSNNAWKATITLSAETSIYLGISVTSGATYNTSCQVMLESGESKSSYKKPSWLSIIDSKARTALPMLDRFWSYAMGKILCIGDSLTSGACFTGNWDGASIDQNYPRLLGRMLNAEVTNAGVSGLTASQWYTNEISKYTLANYDTFIIWLGTNDGLTDTLDTDVNPYSDYNDFANTNTGNYCKIIEKIKADNSDCMIILTKVFVSDTTNTVIDKIATKYSLPVVDNSDLTVADYPVLHGNINNVHFTKTGNLFIANRYVMGMAEIFADNPAMTNYGLTARTN